MMDTSNPILKILEHRFKTNQLRHPNIIWEDVHNRIIDNPRSLEVLRKMEETGGEPDVISHDKKSDSYIFNDCSPESPIGRRSICYDQEGLESRKNHKPKTSAFDMAIQIGCRILNEEEYYQLQKLGPFDQKTSSWLLTPKNIRNQGGAIFGDFRYGQTFTYHNGAGSYHAARGFRGMIQV